MTLAYNVYTEDEKLIGRMRPSTEIIVGMMKTQFLPDGKTAFIKGIQEDEKIWDEAHALKLGELTHFKMEKEILTRPVRIRQTMGTVEEEFQYPDWKMV